MNKTYNLQLGIIKKVLIVDCILIVISFFASENPMPWILGYIFGGLIGILNFMHLGRTIETAVSMHPKNAQAYASSKYFIRYFISAVVIVISLKADYIHILGTIIGLLLVKFVIMSTYLFSSVEYYKRIFKRREDN